MNNVELMQICKAHIAKMEEDLNLIQGTFTRPMDESARVQLITQLNERLKANAEVALANLQRINFDLEA